MSGHEVQSGNSDWRENKLSMKAILSYIYTKDDIYHDVVFIVGKLKIKIAGHKLILCLRSKKFDELIFPKQEEAESAQSAIVDCIAGNTALKTKLPEILLSDVNPEAFRILLKYVYTDAIQLETSQALDVLYASKKFELPVLSAHCIQMLCSSLKVDNVISVFEAAVKMSVLELSTASLKFIFRNAQSVISTQDFTKMGHNNMCSLLESDFFVVEELVLFKRVMSWAKEECTRFEMEQSPENLRYVLKRAVSLIRFPLMKIIDFTFDVVPSEILDKETVIKLYKYFAIKENCPSRNCEDLVNDMFITSPRVPQNARESTVSHFEEISNSLNEAIPYSENKCGLWDEDFDSDVKNSNELYLPTDDENVQDEKISKPEKSDEWQKINSRGKKKGKKGNKDTWTNRNQNLSHW